MLGEHAAYCIEPEIEERVQVNRIVGCRKEDEHP